MNWGHGDTASFADGGESANVRLQVRHAFQQFALILSAACRGWDGGSHIVISFFSAVFPRNGSASTTGLFKQIDFAETNGRTVCGAAIWRGEKCGPRPDRINQGDDGKRASISRAHTYELKTESGGKRRRTDAQPGLHLAGGFERIAFAHG